jgi:hypothetical protein
MQEKGGSIVPEKRHHSPLLSTKAYTHTTPLLPSIERLREGNGTTDIVSRTPPGDLCDLDRAALDGRIDGCHRREKKAVRR